MATCGPGCDVVFHCATAAPAAANTADRALMHAVNVAGTRNVIDACMAGGVRRLVYTSSASVVFDGRDLVGGDERAPYAAKPIDYYTETKVPRSFLQCPRRCKGSAMHVGTGRQPWTIPASDRTALLRATWACLT